MEFLLGGLSGCCAGVVTNTFDVSELLDNLDKSNLKNAINLRR